MKNSDCEIQIILKSGWKQRYKKIEGKGWIQITNGIRRYMTAEQLLSHILPLLAENYRGNAKLRVINRKFSS